MRLCEFETRTRTEVWGIELFASARYVRGDVPTKGEFDYIDGRVKKKFPNAELVGMTRTFVPTSQDESKEVWWQFKWIDFTKGGAE